MFLHARTREVASAGARPARALWNAASMCALERPPIILTMMRTPAAQARAATRRARRRRRPPRGASRRTRPTFCSSCSTMRTRSCCSSAARTLRSWTPRTPPVRPRGGAPMRGALGRCRGGGGLRGSTEGRGSMEGGVHAALAALTALMCQNARQGHCPAVQVCRVKAGARAAAPRAERAPVRRRGGRRRGGRGRGVAGRRQGPAAQGRCARDDLHPGWRRHPHAPSLPYPH